MNRISYPILKKRYDEARKVRDKFRDENLELAREIKKLNKQVEKLEKDLLEMSYLLEIKIDEIRGECSGGKSESNY